MANGYFKRRKPTKLPKKIYYLVCEGQNTEPQYFSEYLKIHNSALIEIITFPAAGVPNTIARKAREIKAGLRIGSAKNDSFSNHDEVWAIFDCDTHPCYESARVNCETWGIGLAYSDPCFELWLVLHEQDHDASGDHHYVQKVLEKIDATYKRGSRKTCDFPTLISKIKDAELRAERQLQTRADENNSGGRPSTTVFRLTRKLRGLDP